MRQQRGTNLGLERGPAARPLGRRMGPSVACFGLGGGDTLSPRCVTSTGCVMGTTNPRIQVMVTQQHYDVISKFSAMMGQSRSALCAEILGDIVPVLEKLGSALEVAKKAEQGVKDGWKASMLQKLDPIQMQAEMMRDESLQLLHGLFETLEGVAAAGGHPPAGGSGSREAAEPPSL